MTCKTFACVLACGDSKHLARQRGMISIRSEAISTFSSSFIRASRGRTTKTILGCSKRWGGCLSVKWTLSSRRRSGAPSCAGVQTRAEYFFMPHDPEKYLDDVLDSCEFLIRHIAGRSIEDYRRDRAFRSAAERELRSSERLFFSYRKRRRRWRRVLRSTSGSLPFGTFSFTGTIRSTRRSSGSCFPRKLPSWRDKCAA